MITTTLPKKVNQEFAALGTDIVFEGWGLDLSLVE